MKINLKKLIIFNVLFIIIIGILSHFLYDWSNENSIVGLFVAVNESTWEHIKLAIFPSLIVFAIQYFLYFKNSNNFFFGVFLSLFTTILLIPIFFYGYKSIVGTNLLFLDILDFIFSVAIGQFIFYKIIKLKKISKIHKILSIVGIIIIIINKVDF